MHCSSVNINTDYVWHKFNLIHVFSPKRQSDVRKIQWKFWFSVWCVCSISLTKSNTFCVTSDMDVKQQTSEVLSDFTLNNPFVYGTESFPYPDTGLLNLQLMGHTVFSLGGQTRKSVLSANNKSYIYSCLFERYILNTQIDWMYSIYKTGK